MLLEPNWPERREINIQIPPTLAIQSHRREKENTNTYEIHSPEAQAYLKAKT